jgi:antitoxin component YwqK of YwqJK toxin-antitoxin module
MNKKKIALFACLLTLFSCGNEDPKASSGKEVMDQNSIISIDLLQKANLKDILKEAISIKDLNWSESGNPANINGTPYTGWVKKSGDYLHGIGYLKNGIEDGPFLFLHENENPKLTGSFNNGLKSGTWTTWKDDGSLISKETWLNGMLKN